MSALIKLICVLSGGKLPPLAPQLMEKLQQRALFLLMLILLLLQSPQSLRRLENLQSLQSLARRNHDQSDSKNGRHSRLYGGQEMDMFTRCTAPGCSDSGSTSSNWM